MCVFVCDGVVVRERERGACDDGRVSHWRNEVLCTSEMRTFFSCVFVFVSTE